LDGQIQLFISFWDCFDVGGAFWLLLNSSAVNDNIVLLTLIIYTIFFRILLLVFWSNLLTYWWVALLVHLNFIFSYLRCWWLTFFWLFWILRNHLSLLLFVYCNILIILLGLGYLFIFICLDWMIWIVHWIFWWIFLFTVVIIIFIPPEFRDYIYSWSFWMGLIYYGFSLYTFLDDIFLIFLAICIRQWVFSNLKTFMCWIQYIFFILAFISLFSLSYLNDRSEFLLGFPTLLCLIIRLNWRILIQT
jgi:hypothetical protein